MLGILLLLGFSGSKLILFSAKDALEGFLSDLLNELLYLVGEGRLLLLNLGKYEGLGSDFWFFVLFFSFFCLFSDSLWNLWTRTLSPQLRINLLALQLTIFILELEHLGFQIIILSLQLGDNFIRTSKFLIEPSNHFFKLGYPILQIVIPWFLAIVREERLHIAFPTGIFLFIFISSQPLQGLFGIEHVCY